MAFTPKFIDLVKNSTTVSGTGAVTLGAALTGFTGFANACVAGDQFYYCIQGIDKPAEREVGRGTFQADGTISRDAALGGPFKNFSSGTKTIALVAAGEWYAKLETLTNAPMSSGGAPTPLFTAAAGSTIAAPIVAITSAGFSVNGVGEARYLQNATVNSAYVTANPRTSFLSADGRGWKLDPGQRLTPEMFGALPGDSSSGAKATNDAAFKAALEHRATAGSYYGSEIHCGPHSYYLGVTLEPQGAFRLVGQTGGHNSGAIAGVGQTRLITPTDVCTIRVRSGWTDGEGYLVGTVGARDSVIKGISIEQLTMGTSATAHGVHMRGNAQIEDCLIINAAGNGVHIHAYTGTIGSGGVTAANIGFADEWRVVNCTIVCGGHGLYVRGNEANAGYTKGVVFHQCGGCAIFDASYLPNAHYSPQITGYGATGVQYGGRKYQLIAEATGTVPGTNAAIWYDLGPLASAGGAFPAWSNVTAYGAKLPFLISNGSPMFGVYQEGGQTQGYSNGIVYGTTAAPTSTTNTLGSYGTVGIYNNRGFARVRSDAGVGTNWPAWTNIGSGEVVSIGEVDYNNGEDGRAYILRYKSDWQGNAGTADTFQFRWSGNSDIMWEGQRRMAWITGRNTTINFGRPAPVPGMIAFDGYAFNGSYNSGALDGHSPAYAKIHFGSNVGVPTVGDHAQGEFCWNLNNPAAGTLGWACTASGTPGTWVAVPVAGFTGTFTTGPATFANVTIGNGQSAKSLALQDVGTPNELNVSMNASGTAVITSHAPSAGYAHRPLLIRGDAITLNVAYSDIAVIASTGMTVTGRVAASGLVTGSNLSGTNSGDQTITLSGDVSGTGTGSFAATIGANKVSFAKIVAASAASLVGASAAGNFAELTPAAARGVLGLAAVASSGSATDLSGTLAVAQLPAMTGDVTAPTGSSATTIGANKVTFAKFVAASQPAFVGASAAGNFGELTPSAATALLSAMGGANGTVAGAKGLVPAPAATDNVKFLRGDGNWVAGNAGTVTTLSVLTANGVSGSVATATSTPAITLTLGAITPTSVAATGAITSSGGGIGYASGAGGAVTQITSRTTGVTLSKLSGAITLFSTTTTAGQTTTLTVTNTQVAATDTVVVTQASGTGIYFCAVSKVLAGSFNLSVYTPAAVGTAEAPVLNFAVVKGVNA